MLVSVLLGIVLLKKKYIAILFSALFGGCYALFIAARLLATVGEKTYSVFYQDGAFTVIFLSNALVSLCLSFFAGAFSRKIYLFFTRNRSA